MEPYIRGHYTVEVKGVYGFDNVLAKLVPRIRLREDVLRKAFRTVASVGFLQHLENQFSSHTP